ncbi:mechanosensitive ion channel family protein [Candidatus Neomarinimicrobiota bacterium]
MDELWSSIASMVTMERGLAIVRALLIISVGYLLAKFVCLGMKRLLVERLDAPRLRILYRSVFYLILALFVVSSLRELGFKLGAILGAAGIFSVALGFAAQTSVSNLISGLFLVSEKAFSVGDIIQAGDKTGEVLAIDLLSVKLRTFDNLFVRIPNEALIKADVTTLTRFPQRRVDLKIGIAYKENLEQVREVLFEIAEKNPLCLKEPEPVCNVIGFGDSSIDLLFGVYAETANFLALKNSIQIEVKETFDAREIEIPFPHISFYPGSTASPLPVKVYD